MEFRVIIPARYASTRLPGKPLVKIKGKYLIEHIYRSASDSDASEVIIATDDEKIEEIAINFGAKVVMTSVQHKSGTDRIAEAVNILGYQDDQIVVNVQGDEFGLQSDLINTVAESLHKNNKANIATLSEKIVDIKTYHDQHSVKVVVDKYNHALYFSRSPIPWIKGIEKFERSVIFKHIGIYAYQSGFLKKYASLPSNMLEKEESLEQLRALYNGYKIYVKLVDEKKGIEINTEEDLKRARNAL